MQWFIRDFAVWAGGVTGAIGTFEIGEIKNVAFFKLEKFQKCLKINANFRVFEDF